MTASRVWRTGCSAPRRAMRTGPARGLVTMRTGPRAHVLMVADAVGGVWTYATQLAGGLGAHGIRPTLAVLGPPPSREALDALRRLPLVEVCHAPFALEWMPDADRDLGAAAEWLEALVLDDSRTSSRSTATRSRHTHP